MINLTMQNENRQLGVEDFPLQKLIFLPLGFKRYDTDTLNAIHSPFVTFEFWQSLHS